MPTIIPMERIIDVVVAYIVKRQMQGRPTTLRQMSRRVGIGVSAIKGLLEKNLVQYILIPYGEKEWVTSSIEIVIQSVPPMLALRNHFTTEEVEESYQRFMGDMEIELLDPEPMEADERINPVDNMDPYASYRIDTRQYQAIKHELISHKKLIREGIKRGFPGRAIDRATGGNRMRYIPAGALWRPYMYRNNRYYLREVLNHLYQVFNMYKRQSTAELKKYRKRHEDGYIVPTFMRKKIEKSKLHG